MLLLGIATARVGNPLNNGGFRMCPRLFHCNKLSSPGVSAFESGFRSLPHDALLVEELCTYATA